MRTLATLSVAALVGLGALTSTGAEARPRGGAIAAGIIGGLAAGALIGAATSGYGHGYVDAPPAYGYGGPAYGYGYGGAGYDPYAAPAPRYRRVVREYRYDDGPSYGDPYGTHAWGGGYGY